MSSSLHCHKTASNANQVLGKLKHNFKIRTPSTFITLYKSLVWPHLEYCAPIWSPHLAKHIEVLEKVRRRATELITSISTLTYEARLEELDLYSLFCWRQRGDLIEVYKTLNSFYCIDPKDIFTLQLDSATRGHQMKLSLSLEWVEVLVNIFSFRVIQQWNDLPQEVVLEKQFHLSRIY